VPGAEVAASVDDVDAGRIDALAVLDDGSWWIVDWKSTLPEAAEAALAEHRDQLERYAGVARSSGAPDVTITLVALDEPDARAWSWRIDALGVATPAEQP